MKVTVVIGFILGIILTIKGIRQDKKKLKYVGYVLIIVCILGVLPEFFSGCIEGFKDGAAFH